MSSSSRALAGPPQPTGQRAHAERQGSLRVMPTSGLEPVRGKGRMAATDLLIGSLFSGMGGLDLGVQRTLGASVVWHVENDPHATQVLARHWPQAPNHGDITTVDWTTVDPVCVLTAGFPCQDLSVAGPRTGLAAGTRSGLWQHVTDAIRALRPCLVVIENVRGLLSTPAGTHTLRHLEPCTRCMGDPSDPPRMRALGVLLADLADLGYDTSWTCLRASAIGAPHRRERVFLTAWPGARHTAATPAQNSDGEPRHQRRLPAPQPPQGPRRCQRLTESEARQRQSHPCLYGGGAHCSTGWDGRGIALCPAAPSRGQFVGGRQLPGPRRGCRVPAAHSDLSDANGGAGTTPKRKGGRNLRTTVTRLPTGGAPTSRPSADGST
ncbi:hypothetical protein BKD26_36850 [Streptomyces sp. CB03238]|nr:hypothetical protein BKD26_36850 [Streptomyces sp. CB03238]